jgi:hypothetical protein
MLECIGCVTPKWENTMHLSRFGFSLLVSLWLIPMVILDFVGNTTSTGNQSDIYFIKAIFDGILLAYAIWQLKRPATVNIRVAQQRKDDRHDDVVDFSDLGAMEYIYCALLVVYSIANTFFFHDVNKHSTGIISIVSLVWTLLSVIILIAAAVQFYHLKQGSIVELRKKVLQ